MRTMQQWTIRVGWALILVMAVALPVLAQASGKVNINTAGSEELAFLPRVGPSVAGRIVQFREENGRFGSIEDLMLVRGIGEKTFELIEPYVKVDGDSDLKEKVSVPRGDSSSEDSTDAS